MITAPERAPVPALRRPTSPRRRASGWGFLRDLLVIILVALVASFLIRTFVVRSFYVPSGSMENTLITNDRVLVNELVPGIIPVQRGDVIVFKDPGGWLSDPQAQSTDYSNPVGDAIGGLFSEIGLGTPDSNDHLIKRVIGLPGDTVICCNPLGQTSVNGVPLDEPYTKDTLANTKIVPFNVTVPADSVWVEGDNRNNSADSRYHLNTANGPQSLTIGDSGEGNSPSNTAPIPYQPNSDNGGFVPKYDIVGRAFIITWPLNRFGILDNDGATFQNIPDPPK